jgi:hypothetical protein
MKFLRRINFFPLAAICVLLFSCGKNPVWLYFTPEEIRWMPYDTAIIQGQFTDELGNIHELRLEYRNVVHQDVGANFYNNLAVAGLILDSHRLDISLYKEPNEGLFLTNANPRLHCYVTFADMNCEDLDIPFSPRLDSLTVDSVYYEGVFVWEADTTWNPNRQCWKIWYAKDRGLIRANFRNGHFYKTQQ